MRTEGRREAVFVIVRATSVGAYAPIQKNTAAIRSSASTVPQ